MPKVVIGVTDLWTTNPQIAELLIDEDIGYEVTSGTHKKADFRCKHCGTIVKDQYIRKVVKNGLKCPVCSDGISYPEKFMSCLLNQLNVFYVRDGCLPWSNTYRYDFYIEKSSMIIETHGAQHYSEEKMFSKSSRKISEKENDLIKKNMAIDNGIENYIEIDARNSSFDYIKNSVLNSNLTKLFNLNDIDWNKLHKDSLGSTVIRVCELYNSGIKSTAKIAENENLHQSTVVDYLKRCVDAGLCDYTPDRHKKIICYESKKVYDGVTQVKEDGFNVSQVSECLNKHCPSAGKCHWFFYDDYLSGNYEVVELSKKIMNNGRKVLCIETGKIYSKLSDAEKDGFNHSGVSEVCNGKRETYKGYHWKYID